MSVDNRDIQRYTNVATGNKQLYAKTVGTGATQLLAANPSRRSMLIANNSSTIIYVGPAGVTTASGIPIAANSTLSDNQSKDDWYGISTVANLDVRVLEVS